MQRLKTCIWALVTTFALSALLATPTLALLPELRTSLGETFPVEGEASGTRPNIATISTELSSPIVAETIKQLWKFTLTSAILDIHLTNVTFEKLECWTEGDADGVVLLRAEVHLIRLALGQFGKAFLLGSATVLCGKALKASLKIPLTGVLLGAIEGITEGTEVTSFVDNTKCTKPNNGKQEFKEYRNDNEEKIKAILTANFGLGSENACLEVNEGASVKLTRMVEFLNI